MNWPHLISNILSPFFQSSTSASGSSSHTQPFYLHPPDSGESVKKPPGHHRTPKVSNNSSQSHSAVPPNLDERLRQYSAYELNRKPKRRSVTSQYSVPQQSSETVSSAEDSSGSFFLHDPSTVSYNRLSDLFPSSAHTVCSDDSGVGLTSPITLCASNIATGPPVHNKIPLSRPKHKPPLPSASLSGSVTGNYYINYELIIVYCCLWVFAIYSFNAILVFWTSYVHLGIPWLPFFWAKNLKIYFLPFQMFLIFQNTGWTANLWTVEFNALNSW